MLPEFSKYRIIEKLGAGGMGEVYKAEDVVLRRTVAIKIVLRKRLGDPDAPQRLLREARAASAIRHQNIVTIYEIGEAGEDSYIAMEYVPGSSLRQLITDRPLTAHEILEIALQCCDALAEAHSARILHRDIKPENILVTERGQVKLVDFGLCKTFKAIDSDPDCITVAESLTASGIVVGTHHYMSPEQLRGEELDARTDIFSFGIVLYEIINSRLPFTGARPLEIAAAILKDPPREMLMVPRGLSANINPVVMKCLEKDRQKRYSSFVEIKRDLLAISLESSKSTVALGTPPAEASLLGKQETVLVHSSPDSKLKNSVPTVLVLPVEVIGSQAESTYIGIGLAHAVRTNLAKISGLSVLSKTAGAGRISQKASGATEVAKELGATILLEGEVICAGDMIEVMSTLTDVESGRVIWGGQYRGLVSDLFGIQDKVCESVIAALKVTIPKEVLDSITRPATSNADAFGFYSKGRAFIERHDVKANVDFAIQMFEEALKLDKHFALAHAGLCEAYWRKYQDTFEALWVERAIAAGDLALVLDPHQAQVHISLGIVYHGTGKAERAIEEFERAIELQPSSDDANAWVARCYVRKGDLERAVSHLHKAIEIRPTYAEHYNNLGECYCTFGKYSEAAEQFRRAITIQPDDFRGYSNLGSMYYLLGSYKEAAAMYERAIEIYPDEDSYANLGTTYFYLDRYEEAVASYRAAIKINARNDVLYCNLGDAFLRLERIPEAEEQFRKAMELLKEQLAVNLNDARLLARVAICAAKLQDEQEAKSSIERATTIEPKNITLMYEAAVVHALIGQHEKAIENLRGALSNGYSRSEAQKDPDLEVLRGERGYAALFGQQE